MEHKIYKIIRKYNIPYFIRLFLAVVFIFLSSFPIILPLFPGSVFLWVFMLVVWVIFIISAEKIKHLRKIRKWIIYYCKNIINKKIREHKMRDIKKHVKQILNKRK